MKLRGDSMKTIKFLLTTIAMLLCSVMANAHDFEVDGIFYDILSSTDLTVEVTYKGDNSSINHNTYSGAIVIPETVTYDGNTYTVTEIDHYANSNTSSKGKFQITNINYIIKR